MMLWRISNHADLSGAGGLQVLGRWHNKDMAIIYLAEHPTWAMMEALIHFELEAYEAKVIASITQPFNARLFSSAVTIQFTPNFAHYCVKK